MIRSVLLAFALAPLSIAAADVATLTPVRDTTLYETTPPATELGNGAGPHLFSGNTAQPRGRRALVRFDFASIPAGSTINAVELRMNVSTMAAASATTQLHPVLADWGEGASNAGSPGGAGVPAVPGDATWNYRFLNTDSWSTPGGDFKSTPSAAVSVTALGPVAWPTNPLLVADVQAWLDAPAGNFGWLLLTPGTGANAVRFDSRENTTEANRPRLIVDFTPPCAADFNGSGAVSVQDIFDFLAAYFAGDASADVNHAGGITVQDIFDYLAAYFTGC